VERDDINRDVPRKHSPRCRFLGGRILVKLRVGRKVAERPQSDAAILDVKLQDKSCVELAKKLSEREIPFLAVSGYSAGTPGLNRIFRSVPWLEKPVTTAGLHLALRSIL